ncbi:hypothetical protein ACVFYP_20290 [Roseomonas sp. F4]
MAEGMGFGRRLLGAKAGRLLLGVLAASLLANLVPVILVLVLTLGAEPAVPLGDVLQAVIGVLPAFPLALMLTLAAGLPVHLLLVGLRRSSPWLYALGGALAGLLALGWIGTLRAELSLAMPVLGAATGLAAALVFRAIWRPLPASG